MLEMSHSYRNFVSTYGVAWLLAIVESTANAVVLEALLKQSSVSDNKEEYRLSWYLLVGI